MIAFSSPEHPSLLVGKGRGWVLKKPRRHECFPGTTTARARNPEGLQESN